MLAIILNTRDRLIETNKLTRSVLSATKTQMSELYHLHLFYSTLFKCPGPARIFFHMTNFVWVLEDSLSYFVESHDGNMYQVIFTDWKGASSGDFTFTTKVVSAIGIGENAIGRLNIYPNPATNVIRFKSEENLNVEIYNYNGSLLKTETVNINGSLNIEDLKAGTYIIKAEGKSNVYMGKILVL